MPLPQHKGSIGESESPTLWVPVYLQSNRHRGDDGATAASSGSPDPSSASTSLSKLLMPNLLVCEMGIISAELSERYYVDCVDWMSSY